jgi:NADH dehydrogenase
MNRARVVIIGIGFAGREAIKVLAHQDVDVLVLDRHNYHTFYPLLYQVAIAGLGPDEIARPGRALVGKYPNVRFRMAEVTGLDLDACQVMTENGPVSYDYLLLAAGSGPEFFGLKGVARTAYPLGNLDHAISLRNHILECFESAAVEPSVERRRELLTFVVVGGGPTGVELAGALAELQRHALRRDFPDLSFNEVRIVLIEMLDTLLPTFSEDLQTYAKEKLNQMDVELLLNTTVQDATCEAVHVKGGQTIPARTIIWAAGVRARLAQGLPFETERGDRIVVEPTLQVPEHPQIFVAGDMAHLTGPGGRPYPQLAPVAMQQGERAAQNILRSAQGEPSQSFRFTDRGTMATIGRAAAVAQVFGREVTGLVAWILWLVVHIVSLMGFRNRLLVLIHWAYDYFRYEPGVRLIVGLRRECPAGDGATEERQLRDVKVGRSSSG